MKEENKNNKKSSDKIASAIGSIISGIILLTVMAFIGVFMFLIVVGVDEICPDYFKSVVKDKDDLAPLKLSAIIQEYGRLSSIIIIIILPITFNILFYWICGFWLTIAIQVIIYFTEPIWGKWYGLE
jgi:hypothetical protein